MHYWQPNHPDHFFRSNVNRTILLVSIGEHCVPIGDKGVKEYNTIGLMSGSASTSSASGSGSKPQSSEVSSATPSETFVINSNYTDLNYSRSVTHLSENICEDDCVDNRQCTGASNGAIV